MHLTTTCPDDSEKERRFFDITISKHETMYFVYNTAFVTFLSVEHDLNDRQNANLNFLIDSSFIKFADVQNQLKNDLHNIISGKSEVRFGAAIQTITRYLGNGAKTSSKSKDSKHFKEKEAERLELYISLNDFWVDDIDFSQYVSEGAEQKVYLKGQENVLKLNDSIYYSSWVDYLNNLLLHNFFFPDTAYELLGFTKKNEILYAVVQQAYVSTTQNTDLNQVSLFLSSNGFTNNRNNDYINNALGIILEDLHDENVLTQNDILYFIDTVFYLTDHFWNDFTSDNP